MIRLATLIDTFEPAFLAKYQSSLLPSQLKALSAIKRCRSTMSPRFQAACTECEEKVFVPHSCGNRNCPHCQANESQEWLDRQISKQVPGDYYLVTFTLPSELRTLVFAHQRTVYDLMMQTSWETVKTFSLNNKKLQGMPGAVAVLHTHSRRLDYHPHVHLVMPAGTIDLKRRLWRTKPRNAKYLFNHKALAKVFRGKLLAALNKAGLGPPNPLPSKWVVDCKPVGNGEKALVYLGRYLYRGVLQEKDILACEGNQVTFRFKNAKTEKMECRTESGVEFLRLLLQHVLPKGLRRTRNFGFLHPNSKPLIRVLQYLHKLVPVPPPTSKRPALLCPCCGAPMRIVRTRIPPHHATAPPELSTTGVPAM